LCSSRSEAEADRDGPAGLRLSTVDAAFNSDVADAAHPHERIADLRGKAHALRDLLAERALTRFAADEDQAIDRFVREC
jgi:hypothetical protein